jgi:hypothetical protein
MNQNVSFAYSFIDDVEISISHRFHGYVKMSILH